MSKFPKTKIICLIIILSSVIVGLYFYPQLPEKVASHWGITGEVNGYMPKFWGVLIMPVISLCLFLLFLIIPKIDPQKENIAKFRTSFNRFIISLFIFLFYLHLLTLYWNLGHQFNLIQYLVPAFAILFFSIGNLISQALPNYTIGIRTPWTLSNPEVWQKTHELGGKLFKISGLISLLGLIFPEQAIWFILIPVLIAAGTSMVYSYYLYQKSDRI